MINLTKEQMEERLVFMRDMKNRRKKNNAWIGRFFNLTRERVRQIFEEDKKSYPLDTKEL